MKVSLTEEPPQETPQALPLATRPEQQLATPATFYNDSDAEGEITRDDVRVPRLNIVGKTGALSDQFPNDQGAIILNRESVLVAKEQPLIVIPVKIRKFYQEDTEFGDDMGKRANKLDEVHAFGGQIEDRDGANFWISVADIDFLIEKPVGASPEVDALFYEEIGGGSYTLARYTASKSAYTAVAKPLFQRKLQVGSVQGMTYHLISKLRKWEGNTWFGPNLRPAGKPSADIVEYLKNLNF